jgi:hypothetical protein
VDNEDDECGYDVDGEEGAGRCGGGNEDDSDDTGSNEHTMSFLSHALHFRPGDDGSHCETRC